MNTKRINTLIWDLPVVAALFLISAWAGAAYKEER